MSMNGATPCCMNKKRVRKKMHCMSWKSQGEMSHKGKQERSPKRITALQKTDSECRHRTCRMSKNARSARDATLCLPQWRKAKRMAAKQRTKVCIASYSGTHAHRHATQEDTETIAMAEEKLARKHREQQHISQRSTGQDE